MFTGISTNTGTIKNITKGTNSEYLIESNMSLTNIKIGSSILCSGICLTVTKKMNKKFLVNISEETLKVTTACSWKMGSQLNLEKSLKLGDELGGHIVTGHIDKTTKLLGKKKLKNSVLLNFYLPKDLRKFICRKGSIAIDGISLTINDVNKKNFFISLIPHTYKVTTLGKIEAGDDVNLEIDVLARYIDNNVNS